MVRLEVCVAALGGLDRQSSQEEEMLVLAPVDYPWSFHMDDLKELHPSEINRASASVDPTDFLFCQR